MKRIIIAAIAQNRVIGSNNNVPWHSPEEFKHFKNTTLGHPVLFGRKSFESIGKPLKDRLNIIITSKGNNFDNILTFNSLHNAYNFLRKKEYHKAFICGGSQIYTIAIKHADEMILSWMKFEAEGDRYFPKFNESLWNVVKKEDHKEYTIFWYRRKKKK